MQDFKVGNFARDHATESFPWYRTLTASECSALVREIARKARIRADGGVVVKHIQAASDPLDHFDARNSRFRLWDVFGYVRVRPRPNVLINWGRFDDIDEMRASDLMRYFSDIWYPASDDIEIFDEQLGWIVSVGHEGDVRALIITGEANAS